MKLLYAFAALLTVTSAGLYHQVPSEIYQAMEYHHAQEQGKGVSQEYDGGYQGHQVAQGFQHQPVQHHNIQTHRVQSQPQHVQFQSQPQQVHVQSHPQHVHFQSQPDQGNIGQSSSHLGQNNHISHSNQHLLGHESGYQNSVENHQNKEAKILNYQHDSDEHNYQYAYETENGIKAQEVGITAGEGTKTQGAYSYTGDDGQVYTVTYTADENGFHPSGAHLPTPPPMPEEIARSIEHNLRDEANGIIDDGHYHHEHDHQEQYTQQSQQHHHKQQPSQGLFQQLQRHNYEQNHQQQQQQQPTTVNHQVQQQKQEEVQPQPKQQQSFGVFQQLKQQNLLQQAPQHAVVQQVQQQVPVKAVYQQQLSPNMFQRFQRHQRPIHQQQQNSVIHQQQQNPLINHQPQQSPIIRHHHHQSPQIQQQQQSSFIPQQVLPHVEEHRHVEYVIPTFTRNVRKQVIDDYVGPAPAPVTEEQY